MISHASMLETLRIDLGLNKVEAKRHAIAVENILSSSGEKPPAVQGGDLLTLHYEINLEYLGGVEKRLASIEALLDDPAVVIEVSTTELKKGKCLLQSVLSKLEIIERKFQRRI